MDSESKRQIDELLSIRLDHSRRLYALERQAAQLGNNAPPEVTIEIEDITAQVSSIDAAVIKLHLAAARQTERNLIGQNVSGASSGESTNERLGALGRYIMFVEDSLRIDLAGLYRLIDSWHDADLGVRKARQRRLDLYMLISIILLVVMIVILVITRS